MTTTKTAFGEDVERPFRDSEWFVEAYPSGGIVVKGRDPKPWKGAHYRVHRAPNRNKQLRYGVAHAIKRWLNGDVPQEEAAALGHIADVHVYLLNGVWVKGEVSGFAPDPNGVREYVIDPFYRAHNPIAHD